MDYKRLVENILNDYLDEHNLKLYDVEYAKEDGNYILRVLIDNLECPIDLDTLEMVNNYLSENLNDDDFKDEYFLEVSSPGAERELKGIEEIKKSISKYVFVKTDKEELQGYLEDATDDEIILKINIKGRIKNIKIALNDIRFIRLAIKF